MTCSDPYFASYGDLNEVLKTSITYTQHVRNILMNIPPELTQGQVVCRGKDELVPWLSVQVAKIAKMLEVSKRLAKGA